MEAVAEVVVAVAKVAVAKVAVAKVILAVIVEVVKKKSKLLNSNHNLCFICFINLKKVFLF
jgi:hypothetical protein